jgi:4'-phosphopantetheinyl transferase EntD
MRGVGIDLAERSTYGHLDEALVRRVADRWLRPEERAWCAAQPSFREAVLIVLSCKEAVYKAWGGSGLVADLSLEMQGHGAAGWAVKTGPGRAPVTASWQLREASILTIAVAAPAGAARDLLQGLQASQPAGPGAGAVVPSKAAPPRRPDSSDA